ncbi:enoyl-CoA hydratase/isomerase family protein [Mycolicibacterium sp. OfavD-34-C]|nr:enoyl-CoA hydratase/isomerase family protein [Mycolicibacterium sp. OfavD-34-C]MCG7581781.1 enoyl-CoA hydratase/isomerase family protein [Mycolicibacterium sp. OfavD-34-C]
MHVADLSEPPPLEDAGPSGVVVAVGDLDSAHAEYWLQRASFTLIEHSSDDPRTVCVDSVPDVLAVLQRRCSIWPVAAATGDDVLRAVDISAPAFAGVITESLAYSTLQSGAEFAAWLHRRGPRTVPDEADPVLADRDADTLRIRFNRPRRHNAFTTAARAALLDALTVARLDPTVTEVVLAGTGPSFCSGGDLDEFGTFTDPAAAHLARTRHSPALALDELRGRLAQRLRAQIHGQVLGSGLEMAAFCGRVSADPQTRMGLPELELGLIPGAGGTVSITRRIRRWRTAYLFLTGALIDARQALQWGLVDEVTADGPAG